MPGGSWTQAVYVAGVWVAAAAVLGWGRLSGPARRALALLASLAGLLFLVRAVNSEGLNESPTVRVFLFGTPYVSERAAASASLPYYVLTAVCLSLGTLGLAVRDDVARKLARHWLATAIVLGFATSLLRFCLEKVAAPGPLTFVMGVTWFPPIVGAFFAVAVREEGGGVTAFLSALLRYALAVRGFVTLMMAAATALRLGTHYDVSSVRTMYMWGRTLWFVPGTFYQFRVLALEPQLGVWPLITIVTGSLGGIVGLALAGLTGGPRAGVLPVPAAQER